MVPKKSKDYTAGSAFVEQPASTRALAIPEILENVLEQTWPCDWKTVNTVNKLWLATVDALIMRQPQVHAYECLRGILVQVCAGKHGEPQRPCEAFHNILGTLLRNPASAHKVEHLDIDCAVEANMQVLPTLAASLRTLSIGSAPALTLQVINAQSLYGITFDHLRAVQLDCSSEISQAVQGLLSGLASLKKLAIVWVYEPSNRSRVVDQNRVQEEIGAVLAAATSARHADLTLPWTFEVPTLATLLPNDLRTLRLSCGGNCQESMLAALVDVSILPHLRALPSYDHEVGFRSHAASDLLETWPQRKRLRHEASDLELLRYWAGLLDRYPVSEDCDDDYTTPDDEDH